MRTLLALMLLLFVSFSAQAQYNVISTVANGGTNYIEQATTRTFTSQLLTVTDAREVAVLVSFKLTGAGTDDITILLDSSLDAVTWEPSEHTIIVAATGTTTVNAITNLTVGACGFLRLASAQNAAAGEDVTNLVVKASYKPGL